VLLVARKLEEGEQPGKALLANFWKKPSNEMESLLAASQMAMHKQASATGGVYDLLESPNAAVAPLQRGGAKVGECYAASWVTFVDSIEAWGRMTPFAQGDLARTAYLFLTTGALHFPGGTGPFFLPIAPLEELADAIGTDRPHRQKEFRRVDHTTSYPALWGHDVGVMKSLAMPPNAWMEINPGKAKRAATLWARKGMLMVVERLRLNTMKLLATRLGEEALACEWWPVRLKARDLDDGNDVTGDEHGKVQALWLNTTPALLSWMALRQDTEGAWVAMKSKTLKLLPLLDISKLTSEQVDTLLALFDRFSKQEMPPFPEQYALAAQCEGVKWEMDREVLKVLLGEEVDIRSLYQLLAREPILTLKPLA